MPAHLHRLEGAQTEWKTAWWSVPVPLYALFFLLCALFYLAEQDCCPCKYVLCTAFLCTPILCVTTSLWNIREAAIAVESAQTVTIIRYYFALCHYYCDYLFDYISKLGGYYVILFQFSLIIPINSVLCHIMSLLFHLCHLQFLDYYVILCHVSEINYYINYVTTIMSIIFFEFIMSIISIKLIMSYKLK